MIMQKPYSINELGRKVREALDQAKVIRLLILSPLEILA